jgi:cytidylate kinase
VAALTGRSFFPTLISKPFMQGMRITFYFSAVMMLIAAAASWLRGKRYVHEELAIAPALASRAEERGLASASSPPRLPALDGGVRTITISASYGSGGEVVSRAVAEKLGLPFLDRAISVRVASELAVPLESVLASQDEARDGLTELVSALAMGAGPLAPGAAPDMEQEDQADLFQRGAEHVIREMARTGGVILGRGAVLVLQGEPAVLHVRLDGPTERRVRRVVQTQRIDEATAKHDQHHTDHARKVYMRHFYGVDGADPGLYHLIIDTTVVPVERAVEMIVEASARTVPTHV